MERHPSATQKALGVGPHVRRRLVWFRDGLTAMTGVHSAALFNVSASLDEYANRRVTYEPEDCEGECQLTVDITAAGLRDSRLPPCGTLGQDSGAYLRAQIHYSRL